MKHTLLAGLISLVSWSAAQAGIMTQTYSQTFNDTDSFEFTGEGSDSVSTGDLEFLLPKFNLPGATLLSAFIEYEVLESNATTTTKNNSMTETATFGNNPTGTATKPDFPPFSPPNPSGEGDGERTLQPGEMITTSSALNAGGFPKLIDDPDDLEDFYVGTGNVETKIFKLERSITISDLMGLTNSEDLVTTGELTNEVKATITYTYQSVVPEPASMALFGLGSLGIGVISRRRQRKQIELSA